jgi:proteasome lid subunit RPN8/RPN11
VILVLRPEHRPQLEREACAALPRECCGLVEGVRVDRKMRVAALHPTRNLADGVDAFEIDPAEQFRLLRRLRGTDRAIVGCYHSHPNSDSQPSQRDCQNPGEDGFLWLIAGLRDGNATFGAYMWSAPGFVPMSIVDSE